MFRDLTILGTRRPIWPKEAERLREGTNWVPKPLRLAGVESNRQAAGEGDIQAEALPAFLAGEDEAGPDADERQPHAIAAE